MTTDGERLRRVEAFASYVKRYLAKGDEVVVTPEGLFVGPFSVYFESFSVVLESVGNDDPDDLLPVYREYILEGVSPLAFLACELEARWERRERIKAKLREKSHRRIVSA